MQFVSRRTRIPHSRSAPCPVVSMRNTFENTNQYSRRQATPCPPCNHHVPSQRGRRSIIFDVITSSMKKSRSVVLTFYGKRRAEIEFDARLLAGYRQREVYVTIIQPLQHHPSTGCVHAPMSVLDAAPKASRTQNCGEVGLVSRPHLLFGGVRSVTTVLKVVEEEQEGLQEIERE